MIVKGLITPQSARQNIGCTWEHQEVLASCPVVLTISLEAPGSTGDMPGRSDDMSGSANSQSSSADNKLEST